MLAKITTDFSSVIGKMKPMHSVNNGPQSTETFVHTCNSNAHWFTKAAIPLVRNHDANFCWYYGAPHTVDILAIFPNFDADENDPASYDFHLTDEYNKAIVDAGMGIFYRLGNRIEHESKRYGSLPPKDPHKWARICEHIIRHMNEGWADGTHYNIQYWEIWNEPEFNPNCWAGTKEQFYELFDITSRHLKRCFPNIKIGGPSIASLDSKDFLIPFFEYLTRDKNDPAPLDFFSFHIYSSKPDKIAMQPVIARELLNSFGYYDTETILNEWNYIRNWMPHEQFHYTVKVISSLKGAAFIGATMLACQKSPLDHLMYYDASLTAVFNGLFDHITGEPLKPYHALYDFSRLYLLGNEVACTSDTDSVYTGAAISDDRSKAVIMLTRYQDLENIDGLEPEADAPTVRIDWSGFTSDTGVRVTYQFLDGYHNNDVCTEETFFGTTGAHLFRMPLYTTILITLEKLQ